MPFAGYSDFAACVADNRDKRSPEGFCAWLEHEVTGQWSAPPSQSMPAEAFAVFREAYESARHSGGNDNDSAAYAQAALEVAGWQHARFGYLKAFESPKMKTVTGVKVFAVGEWTDSGGFSRAWVEEELLRMVSAFNAGVPSVVALKAGHTTDSFNKAVAEALDVPVLLITGETGGNGQVSLGKMSSLEFKGGLLVASFERVPEAVANLIDSRMYNTVSAEIEDEIGEFGPVITGVALLGAEEPAVDVATLDRAMVFGGKRDGARVLTFAVDSDIPIDKAQLHEEFASLKDKMADAIKGMKGAPIFRAMLAQLDGLFRQIASKGQTHQATFTDKQYQEENEVDEETLKALAVILGLDEAATLEDVVGAIKALVEKAAGQPPPTEPMASPELAQLAEKVKDLESKNSKLEHESLLSKYAKETIKLVAIEGKPDVMAEELAGIEENHGPESATKMLGHYQKSNDLNKKAIAVLGTELRTDAEPPDEHPFEAEVKEYAKEKKQTYAVALSQLSQQKPQEYAAYRRATRPPVPAAPR